MGLECIIAYVSKINWRRGDSCVLRNIIYTRMKVVQVTVLILVTLIMIFSENWVPIASAEYWEDEDWIMEEMEEIEETPVFYDVSDMQAWNMVNLEIHYIGSLLEKSKGKGVTTKNTLNFSGDLVLYDIIDGYAYLPSGRNIYKIAAEMFGCIEKVGPTEEVLDAYRTVYFSSSKARKHNIELVAHFLDGTVIEPRKTFSYNQTTGPRSYEMGYQIATVIVNGEYSQDYGGGVCQVSSTIYAAIMHDSNISIKARRPHGLEVTYLPDDMDATVSYGGIDLKFINNYPFAVVLHVTCEEGVCMVMITRE